MAERLPQLVMNLGRGEIDGKGLTKNDIIAILVDRYPRLEVVRRPIEEEMSILPGTRRLLMNTSLYEDEYEAAFPIQGSLMVVKSHQGWQYNLAGYDNGFVYYNEIDFIEEGNATVTTARFRTDKSILQEPASR